MTKYKINGFFFLSICCLLLSISSYAQTQNHVPIVAFNRLEQIIANQKDSIYVINFWATWCLPCVKELPEFEAIQNNPSIKKIKIILVSLDDSKQRVVNFIKKKNIRSQVIMLESMNPNIWVPKISPEWDGAIPVTLIKYKQKQRFINGSTNKDELYKIITSISS